MARKEISHLGSEILLRKGRLANVINARDQFIREGVLEQGYEAFIREGAKVNYRAEWHPGDGRRF